MRHLISIFLVPVLSLVITLQSFSQEKKALTLEDYPEWSRIGSAAISNNGNWISYAYQPNEGDDTLYFKNLNNQKVYEEAICSNPRFSDNSSWTVFYKNLPEKEIKKLKKSKKPVYKKAVLLNLETGAKTEWEKAGTCTFSPTSNFLLIKKPGNNKAFKGTDLLVFSMEHKWTLNLGNVTEYKFNSQGDKLAYLVDANDKAGNGVYVLEMNSRIIRPLDTDTLSYSGLTWDDVMLYPSEKGSKGTALATLKGEKSDSLEQRVNQIVLITSLNSLPYRKVISTADLSGIPEGFVISEYGSIKFSLDNDRLVVAIKEQSPLVKMSKDTLANVDIWHWEDEEIQSVQMKRATREKRSTYSGIIDLKTNKFLQLESDNMRSVSLNRNGDKAIGRNPKPYINDTNWGGGSSDYYVINTTTGEKTLVAKEIGRSMGMSPDGQYFLYFKNRNFHLFNLASKRTINLTGNMEVSFFNTEEDHPYENPSYGIAGWQTNNSAIIINHKYDIWAVATNGSGGTNLTGNYGSDQEIKFRLIRMNRDPYIDLNQDQWVSAYGEWTKKAGIFQLNSGKKPKRLLYTNHSYGRIQKAKDADEVLFTRQTFVDFPDYYTSNLSFNKVTKQTEANPQQINFKWGKRVLIDFENSHGDHLQGTLTLPAGYEKGKKYPMLVYFYEKMSQRHHSYSMPTYDDRPHMSTYASNGYLVFMPDIKYYEGQPGNNAVDCITSAVKKVIDLGYADSDKIGLQGHSWGGYQSSFILTQTDMFACVVTGAPVTNLTSMYNILYKNSGSNNHGIFEKGQVRMGKSMYEDMENYIAQSPVQQAAGISTPFMILQGTVDGAVDWNQGLEFYNAARRLGKEVILLSYPNENHHLANRNNQKDFQIRMKQYFDHYLMGAAAPDWIVSGVKFVDKLYGKAK